MPNGHADNNSTVAFPYRIASRYQCISYLGGGGSGLVFKAWDELLQRMVAIKFIRHPSYVAKQRLLEEARALAKVNHPSICSIYDIGEPVSEHSSLFMVMELIEGTRLSEQAGKLPIAVILRIMQHLTEGVALLHSAGLVHNDINPANIIIKRCNADDHIPTLIDLSVANIQSSGPRVRHAGFGVTPLFGAPEQKKQNVEHRELVDIYSLGAVLFFLITGQAPSEKAEQLLKSDTERCPKKLADIVLKCIAEQPSDRYQSATILAQELAKFQYQRSPIKHTALWGSGIVALILLSLAVSQELSGPSSYDAASPLSQDFVSSLHSKANAYILMSKEALHQGDRSQAEEYARRAVNGYRRAIIEQPGDLASIQQLADFLGSYSELFSKPELSAILLDMAAKLSQISADKSSSAVCYGLAKMYYQLALMHESQSDLVERWNALAVQYIESALQQHPDSRRYQQLRRELESAD